MNKKAAGVILIILTIFFSGACSNLSKSGSQSSNVENELSKAEKPISGGTINLAAMSSLNLDPLNAANEDDKNILSLIYEGLVKVDGQGKIQPALAENWQIDETGTTYTFNLRQDVKWHSGESFSSNDVKATFDRVRELKKSAKSNTQALFAEFNNVQSYDAPNAATFVVHLYKPDPDFLNKITCGIIPASSIEALKASNASGQSFAGTGPFEIVSKTSDSITLKRNESYYDKKPYIKEVNIKIFPDKETAKEAFMSSSIDVIEIGQEDYDKFSEVKDSYMLQYPSRYFEFVALNLTNPLFSDANVRQAMLMGIDRNRILQDTIWGRGLIVDGPILPYSWAFNPNAQHIEYNKKLAAEKLEELGWKDENGDGILEKTIGTKKYKFEFELLVNASDSARYQAASHIAEDLKELGISVKITNLNWEELRSKVMSKKYEAAIMGWKLAPNPDLGVMFSSSEIKNGYNFVSYSNKELDDVLNKIQTSRDENNKKELLYKASEIISRDLPYLFLYSPNDILALNTRVQGVNPNPINVFYNISEWWLKQ
ncbi:MULTISPECIES: ABC transporter substrate-binding protein [Tepidanaerobacter]|uniref:ABC transporter substrate-binding protein n=1 Tax=Tepidanaerobacter TaxID=499228 RepID=UPI000AFF3678|nr:MULTISPECIES: ABC transporter substrate-binding protein [Tepidanaerobacter]GLI50448.1 peptide-binding protein [Tepidanaerobacter syntrophicus]